MAFFRRTRPAYASDSPGTPRSAYESSAAADHDRLSLYARRGTGDGGRYTPSGAAKPAPAGRGWGDPVRVFNPGSATAVVRTPGTAARRRPFF